MNGLEQEAKGVQNQVDDGATASQNDPVDIAAAFQMVRQIDKKAAEPAVDEGAGSEEPGLQVREQGANGEALEGGSVGDAYEPAPSAAPAGQGAADEAGGPAAAVPATDYRSAQRGLIGSIQRQAQHNVLREFKDNGVKHVSIGDLYKRSSDGRVTFVNPDDPHNDFTSRQQAQGYIDSINSQIDAEFQRHVYAEQQKLMQQAMPSMRLLEFGNRYESMNPDVREIFDELVEQYELKDQSGQVYGYNCDLDKIAGQAERIVSRWGGGAAKAPQQAQAEPPKPKTPALDIKTGSGESPDERDPKDINEAWAMLNKRKKETKNGK